MKTKGWDGDGDFYREGREEREAYKEGVAWALASVGCDFMASSFEVLGCSDTFPAYNLI